MTNKKERESGHIDPGRPVSSLSREELAHLSSCQFCREQIALQTEKQELLAAPARMKSEILSKLNLPEVQIIAKSNRISKKLELFYFSLRVGTAVLCSLALLSFAPALPGAAEHPIELRQEDVKWEEDGHFQRPGTLSPKNAGGAVWEASSYVTEQINRLLNLEVFKYDKKER